MGRGYERNYYRLEETLFDNKNMLLHEHIQPSAYHHPELEDSLPEQTLLINGELKG